jgi:hypothetical protein
MPDLPGSEIFKRHLDATSRKDRSEPSSWIELDQSGFAKTVFAGQRASGFDMDQRTDAAGAAKLAKFRPRRRASDLVTRRP